MVKELTVLDLFCGAGGLSHGFNSAGFKVVMGIDHNQKAIDTFLANHKESQALCGDMTKIKSRDILEKINGNSIDVVIGGPPCQGFSMAGKRQPNDPRNSLFMEYLRIVKDIRPKVFLMENVKGLLSMKNEKGIKVVDIILEEFGKLKEYDVELHQVNAANYGVPQRRQRIFIIGVKKGIKFSFPLPTHSKNDHKLKEWIGVGEVILDKNKVSRTTNKFI